MVEAGGWAGEPVKASLNLGWLQPWKGGGPVPAAGEGFSCWGPRSEGGRDGGLSLPLHTCSPSSVWRAGHDGAEGLLLR